MDKGGFMNCQNCGSNIGERDGEFCTCIMCGRASGINGELVLLSIGSPIIQDHKKPHERRKKGTYRSHKYD